MMADLYAPSLEKAVSEIEGEVDTINNLKWEYADSSVAALQDITENTFVEDNRKVDTTHNDLVEAIKKLTKTNLLW